MIDHHARAEDVRWFVETGESLSGAAQRLGIKPSALDQWCRRMGMTAECNVLRSREPFDWNGHVGRDQLVKGALAVAERRRAS